jgi:hypothetical protein
VGGVAVVLLSPRRECEWGSRVGSHACRRAEVGLSKLGKFFRAAIIIVSSEFAS